MYPRWAHYRDLTGTCPVCGAPAHVGGSERTGRFFWLHDGYDMRELYRSHAGRGLAEIEWDELKGLFDEAEARGNEPRATCGGGEAVSKRVRCVETGVVYRSIRGAADAVSRSRASLSAAVKRGGTCAGFHWELV